jgi:acetyltransferase
LFDSIQVFSQPRSEGRNVAIISNAGGPAVLTADWCYKLGLSIPKLPSDAVEEVRSFLPPIASPFNPVDMTGDADYERYKKVLEIVSDEKTVDIVLSIFVSQGLVTSDGPARAVVETQKTSDKPFLAYWMGGNSIVNGVRILRRGGVPVYSSPERMAKAAVKLTLSRDKDRSRKKGGT